jgi:hypothetical protein
MKKIPIKYALRDPSSGRYWNGKIPTQYNGNRWKFHWAPYFVSSDSKGGPPEAVFLTKDKAEKASRFYEIIREIRDPLRDVTLPHIELVSFEKAHWRELSSEPISIDPILIRAERYRMIFGNQFADSYDRQRRLDNEFDRYQFAFRRSLRRGEKEELLQRFGDMCVIDGPIVWVKSEADLIAFKLTFSESFGRVYYIDDMRKSRNS